MWPIRTTTKLSPVDSKSEEMNRNIKEDERMETHISDLQDKHGLM
jgi:hypothetical protein